MKPNRTVRSNPRCGGPVVLAAEDHPGPTLLDQDNLSVDEGKGRFDSRALLRLMRLISWAVGALYIHTHITSQG